MRFILLGKHWQAPSVSGTTFAGHWEFGARMSMTTFQPGEQREVCDVHSAHDKWQGQQTTLKKKSRALRSCESTGSDWGAHDRPLRGALAPYLNSTWEWNGVGHLQGLCA